MFSKMIKNSKAAKTQEEIYFGDLCSFSTNKKTGLSIHRGWKHFRENTSSIYSNNENRNNTGVLENDGGVVRHGSTITHSSYKVLVVSSIRV